VTLAVAGFDKDEIEIRVENRTLSIKGTPRQGPEKEYVFRGIAHRAFLRQFQLDGYMEVVGANLDKGILSIDLRQNLPEAMKPRSISINSEG
jgi:molecular chaperone IbpA